MSSEPEISGEATMYAGAMAQLLGPNVRAGIGARVWIESPSGKGWFEVIDRELGETPVETVYHLRLVDAPFGSVATTEETE